MKYIIIATLVIVLGILGGIQFKGHKVEVINNVPQIVEKEVVINPIDERIKQREDELTEKYNKIKGLEARRDVLQAERDRLDSEVATITKELATFMTATTSKR